MDFDPNSKKKPVYEWATYIPDRKTEFKAHRSLGHAKNAFQSRSNAILYHHEGGEWVEKYRIENYVIPSNCEWCGESTLIPGYGSRTYNSGNRIWPKDGELRIYWICRDCRWIHHHGAEKGKKRINQYYTKKIIDLLKRKVGEVNLVKVMTTKSDALYDKSIQELIDAGMAKETWKIIEDSFDWSDGS